MPITSLVCPTNCIATLPDVAFDDCAPKITLSQGNYLYIAKPVAAVFADASLPGEWADRLSQDSTIPTGSSATVDDLIRTLTIIGDIPAASITEKDISGSRKYVSKTERVINVEIDDATAKNYEFVRTTECFAFKCKAWYETEGANLFGGNSGILGTLYLTPVLGRGVDEIEKYVGTFKWDSRTSPDRCVSPIAH